jgi:hypothetical protein
MLHATHAQHFSAHGHFLHSSTTETESLPHGLQMLTPTPCIPPTHYTHSSLWKPRLSKTLATMGGPWLDHGTARPWVDHGRTQLVTPTYCFPPTHYTHSSLWTPRRSKTLTTVWALMPCADHGWTMESPSGSLWRLAQEAEVWTVTQCGSLSAGALCTKTL